MNNKDSLLHTNDVPIQSIRQRSPALWGILTRALPETDCRLADELFLIAVRSGGNEELIEREAGVTFNARLARVIQIATEAHPLSIPLIIECLLACCPDKQKFIHELTLKGHNVFQEGTHPFSIIARSATMLDELRHLHLSKNSKEEIKSAMEKARMLSAELNATSNEKLSTLLDAAIQRIRKKLP